MNPLDAVTRALQGLPLVTSAMSTRISVYSRVIRINSIEHHLKLYFQSENHVYVSYST